ncbi:MAG: hypothetical protein ACR2MP_15125 [Streptosporangiaceae bacterium]
MREVDTQQELLGALATLSARQRAVSDLPEAEVAGILGCSAGIVKNTASRGLARLRTTIQDDASGHRAHDAKALS